MLLSILDQVDMGKDLIINFIEAMSKEIKRRNKTMDSQPKEESDMSIVYLKVVDINEKWSLLDNSINAF